MSDYDELSEYVDLEGTELGEYCNSLLLMRDHHPSHGMSDEFDAAINKEIAEQLAAFKKYSRIVERNEEVIETRIYKELEWLEPHEVEEQ